jgi:hypothetical protein
MCLYCNFKTHKEAIEFIKMLDTFIEENKKND